MRIGYNTNGLAHHDPAEGIALLAELGYRSVALTLDHGWLNPFHDDYPRQLERMRELLQRYQLRSVIETGARFLLDPRRKHEPTLVSVTAEQRGRRTEFLCRAIDVARQLNSDCVSFWSGIVHDRAEESVAWKRLIEGLLPVVDYAHRHGVVIGFEPEPGMFIDTMNRFDQLSEQINAPVFQLTLDIGHLHCQGEVPIAEYITQYAARIVNVHIEDMRAGVHEHLMFGEGEMVFEPILRALDAVGYQGGLHVELSRHSHDAVQAARRALEFLQARWPGRTQRAC